MDEQLRDRLVDGLRSESIQRRLLSEGNVNLQRAYEIALSMEAASREASGIQATSKDTTVPAVGHLSQQRRGLCYRCGKSGHSPDQCYYKKLTCRTCGKKGHIAVACRNPGKDSSRKPGNSPRGRRQFQGRRAQHVEELPDPRTPSPEFELPMFTIRTCTVRDTVEHSITVDLQVNGIPLVMELDTGAAVSIISKQTWKRLFPNLALEDIDLPLATYTGERMKILRQIRVRVECNQQKLHLPLVVVEGQGPPLFGSNWLCKARLNWMHIIHMSTELDHLLHKYGDVFRSELGTLKGIEAKLVVPCLLYTSDAADE